MEVRLLVGAHLTGQEHLRSQLEANRAILERDGTLLPDRATATQAFAVALKAIRRGTTNDQTGPNFISHLTEGKDCDRVLLLDANISGVLQRPSKNGSFYPRASSTISQFIKQLDGHADVRVYFATRNPATFLPACWVDAMLVQPDVDFPQFVAASDPHDLRWSEFLHQIQGRDQEVSVTTWDWDSYPTNWRMIAQAFSGIQNKEDLVDCGAPLPPGMSTKGANLMHSYLKEHPTSAEADFEKVRTRFCEEFPYKDTPAFEELWPQNLVAELTDAYSDDLYYIERMEGMTFVKAPVYA